MTARHDDARERGGRREHQDSGLPAQDTTIALAATINAEHHLAFGKAREALEHARRAGELLIEAKAAVDHGQWLPWIAENCKFSARQAQRYILLAENWAAIAAKYDTVSFLGLREALKLLSPPVDRLEEMRLCPQIDDLEEMRSLGGEYADLADRWTGSRDDAEDLTRLIGQKIADDCRRLAERFEIDEEFVVATVFAMLGQYARAFEDRHA